MAIHPTCPDTIYAALDDGVYRSVDGGEGWTRLTQIPGYGQQVVFDPQNPNVIYARASGGLNKSSNCGNTWNRIESFGVSSFAIDPSNTNRLYAGSTRGMYIWEVWVGVSSDGGASWTETEIDVDRCGDYCFVSALAVDPIDSNIVYAGMEGDWDIAGSGVYKTTDGGLTWQKMSSGLPFSNISCIRIDPADPQTIYAGTSGSGMYSGSGVFRTTNGGLHWEDVNNGIPEISGWIADIPTIAMDPIDTNVLYAGTWSSGVFVTVDGGLVWRSLGTGTGSSGSYCLTLDPSDPNKIYSAWGGLWRYTRTTSCVEPEIISYSPTLVNSDNCADSCVVSFNIDTQDDCSEVAVVTLERSLGGKWIQEDYILSPDSGEVWTLTFVVDEHFSDGEHEFRAVARCKDGSREVSESVIVTADRGVPVTISRLEAGYSEGIVRLHWSVSNVMELQGFNVYRSLRRDSGFKRLNEALIPVDFEYEFVDDDLEFGHTYWYLVGAVGFDGEWFSATTSVLIPSISLQLFQNYPNPFNPTTTISFTLPKREQTRLSIYNIEGKLVKTLVKDSFGEDFREVTWNGTDTYGSPVSSGVYFYRLKAGDRTLTKKMVLIK